MTPTAFSYNTVENMYLVFLLLPFSYFYYGFDMHFSAFQFPSLKDPQAENDINVLW